MDNSYVLIHVHEGTMINAWGFDTLDEAQAFQDKYKIEEDDPREGDVPDLPEVSYSDDWESDTWILVEGIRIEYVDGDRPYDGRKYVTPEEVGAQSYSFMTGHDAPPEGKETF